VTFFDTAGRHAASPQCVKQLFSLGDMIRPQQAATADREARISRLDARVEQRAAVFWMLALYSSRVFSNALLANEFK
jgi:hypothetical protein